MGSKYGVPLATSASSQPSALSHTLFTPAAAHCMCRQVSLPGHICAAVVTTLVLEGWSSKLDPDHSVMTQVGTALMPGGVPIPLLLGLCSDA